MMKDYIQGGDNDHDLFGLIGALISSKDVHAELGAPLTSVEGDYWFVHVGTSGFSNGFAQMRVLANGTAHIRYAYSANAAVRSAVIRAAVAKAKKLEAELVFTSDRKSDETWPELEFKKQPNKRKGEFVRWERLL